MQPGSKSELYVDPAADRICCARSFPIMSLWAFIGPSLSYKALCRRRLPQALPGRKSVPRGERPKKIIVKATQDSLRFGSVRLGAIKVEKKNIYKERAKQKPCH